MSDTKLKSDMVEARQRNAYLGIRIKELQAEIKSMKLERTDLTEKLRALTDRSSPEAKLLKTRRAYVQSRPVDAKAELEAAMEERKELIARLRA